MDHIHRLWNMYSYYKYYSGFNFFFICLCIYMSVCVSRVEMPPKEKVLGSAEVEFQVVVRWQVGAVD